MHDIYVALSKHYIENIREEVKKGMREKAEQGIYPGRAPLGYRNNSAMRNIEVSAEKARSYVVPSNSICHGPIFVNDTS
jgi:DNA invertase Pin-like site-specific DNA recombinase